MTDAEANRLIDLTTDQPIENDIQQLLDTPMEIHPSMTYLLDMRCMLASANVEIRALRIALRHYQRKCCIQEKQLDAFNISYTEDHD